MNDLSKEGLRALIKEKENDLVIATNAQNQFMTRKGALDLAGSSSISKLFGSLDNKIVKLKSEIHLLTSKMNEL